MTIKEITDLQSVADRFLPDFREVRNLGIGDIQYAFLRVLCEIALDQKRILAVMDQKPLLAVQQGHINPMPRS